MLQVRTTLNMLGPLLNPAGAAYGLIGVYSPDISMLMAQALQQLGSKKALVVHSQVCARDEASVSASTCHGSLSLLQSHRSSGRCKPPAFTGAHLMWG